MFLWCKIVHAQQNTHTRTHTLLKDTFSAKPKVILTPGEVLFWHINLGQRKEMKILRSHLPLPQVWEREREMREKKRGLYRDNGDEVRALKIRYQTSFPLSKFYNAFLLFLCITVNTINISFLFHCNDLTALDWRISGSSCLFQLLMFNQQQLKKNISFHISGKFPTICMETWLDEWLHNRWFLMSYNLHVSWMYFVTSSELQCEVPPKKKEDGMRRNGSQCARKHCRHMVWTWWPTYLHT